LVKTVLGQLLHFDKYVASFDFGDQC
jgi:hypothetical protein